MLTRKSYCIFYAIVAKEDFRDKISGRSEKIPQHV